MLKGDGNKNGKKINRTNWQNKKNCRCSTLLCTFLCRCFARLKRETTRHVCVWRKCCGSQLFAKKSILSSCSLFFHCRSFFTLLAASISHFLTATTKFSSFFQRNSSRACLLDSPCCCFFLCKCPGGHEIYRQNERVLECEISLRPTCRGVRTDAGHVIAKISRIYRLPVFLTHDASLRALHERSTMRI